MGLRSRYLRGARWSELGSLRHSCWSGREVFRFRYPRAVDLGGSGKVAGRASVGEEVASWYDDYRLARAFAVTPVAPQGRRSPCGRWGLTAQHEPSKGAIMPSIRRCASPQAQPGLDLLEAIPLNPPRSAR